MLRIRKNRRHGVLLSTPSQTTHAFLPILRQLLGVGSEYGVSTIPSRRYYLGGCGNLVKWNLAGEVRALRFWEGFGQSWAMSPFCKGNYSALPHLPSDVDWSLRNHEPKSTLRPFKLSCRAFCHGDKKSNLRGGLHTEHIYYLHSVHNHLCYSGRVE